MDLLESASAPKFVIASAAVIAPVPPFVRATVPVTLAAFPAISPLNLEPDSPAILASVTFRSAILVVVMALLLILGSAAVLLVPAKSPDNWILPRLEAVASGRVVPSCPGKPRGPASPTILEGSQAVPFHCNI